MRHIWGFLKFIAAAFCGASVFWLALSYQTINLPDAISPEPLATLDITHIDFLTVMLTCVTVVLAAVGIGVGVVAAYTITNLKNDAKAEVKMAVDNRMKDVEEKLNRVEANLEEKVTAFAYGVGRNLDDGADADEEER